jgi:hypothetical protein
VIKVTELKSVESPGSDDKPAEKEEGQPLVKIYYADSRGESNVYEDGRTCESVTKRPKESLWITKQDKEKNQTTDMIFSLTDNGSKLIVKFIIFSKIAKSLPLKMASGAETVFIKVN